MKIKDLIKDRLEISVSQFCKNTCISRQTFYNILNDRNKRGVSLVMTKKICKYFNVNYRDYI